jgi:hypothetical protein
MRLTASACLTVLLATLGPPAAAATLVLPGAAHNPGDAGTTWVTDLRVLNPGGQPAAVAIAFTPYDGGAPHVQTLTLASGELLALDDVVARTFGLAGPGFVVLNSNQTLVAGQRTSNVTPDGSYGQYIPGVAPVAASAYLTGLRGVEFRTNVGLVNASATVNHVVVRVGDGLTQDLAPGFGTQLEGVDAWNGFDSAGESGSVAGSGPLLCYASVVDNRTGDPTWVPALQPSTVGVVAGLAHNPGAGGTLWRSDLYLYALDAAVVTGTLVFYDEVGTAATPQMQEDLQAGETRTLEDVVALLAPGRTGSGVLWLSSDAPVVAVARTYNLAADGTFGQTMTVVARGEEVQPGQQGLFLLAARAATGQAGYRSNLALVNPGLTYAGYAVELLSPTGAVLGSGAVTVPPRSAVQRNDVVAWLGVPELADGVIRVTGVLPFTGYLSSVDNRTGDASTVPPVAYAPGR